jgi:hypothetical protein
MRGVQDSCHGSLEGRAARRLSMQRVQPTVERFDVGSSQRHALPLNSDPQAAQLRSHRWSLGSTESISEWGGGPVRHRLDQGFWRWKSLRNLRTPFRASRTFGMSALYDNGQSRIYVHSRGEISHVLVSSHFTRRALQDRHPDLTLGFLLRTRTMGTVMVGVANNDEHHDKRSRHPRALYFQRCSPQEGGVGREARQILTSFSLAPIRAPRWRQTSRESWHASHLSCLSLAFFIPLLLPTTSRSRSTTTFAVTVLVSAFQVSQTALTQDRGCTPRGSLHLHVLPRGNHEVVHLQRFPAFRVFLANHVTYNPIQKHIQTLYAGGQRYSLTCFPERSIALSEYLTRSQAQISLGRCHGI